MLAKVPNANKIISTYYTKTYILIFASLILILKQNILICNRWDNKGYTNSKEIYNLVKTLGCLICIIRGLGLVSCIWNLYNKWKMKTIYCVIKVRLKTAFGIRKSLFHGQDLMMNYFPPVLLTFMIVNGICIARNKRNHRVIFHHHI